MALAVVGAPLLDAHATEESLPKRDAPRQAAERPSPAAPLTAAADWLERAARAYQDEVVGKLTVARTPAEVASAPAHRGEPLLAFLHRSVMAAFGYIGFWVGHLAEDLTGRPASRISQLAPQPERAAREADAFIEARRKAEREWNEAVAQADAAAEAVRRAGVAASGRGETPAEAELKRAEARKAELARIKQDLDRRISDGLKKLEEFERQETLRRSEMQALVPDLERNAEAALKAVDKKRQAEARQREADERRVAEETAEGERRAREEEAEKVRLAAEEQQRLREAEERRLAEAKAEAERKAREEDAEQARIAAEAQRLADARAAEERERAAAAAAAARASAEAFAAQAERERVREARRLAEEQQRQREAEERRVAEAKAEAERKTREEEAERVRLAAAEAQRLADARAAEERERAAAAAARASAEASAAQAERERVREARRLAAKKSKVASAVRRVRVPRRPRDTAKQTGRRAPAKVTAGREHRQKAAARRHKEVAARKHKEVKLERHASRSPCVRKHGTRCRRAQVVTLSETAWTVSRRVLKRSERRQAERHRKSRKMRNRPHLPPCLHLLFRRA